MIQQGTSKLPCVGDNAADACARFEHAVVMSVAPSGYSLPTLHQLTAVVFSIFATIPEVEKPETEAFPSCRAGGEG